MSDQVVSLENRSLQQSPADQGSYRRAGAVALLSFSALVCALAVIFLAATLSQGRLASVLVNGINVSIWRLDAVQAQWQSLQALEVERRDILRKAERLVAEAQYAQIKLAPELAAAKLRALSAARNLAQQASDVVPGLADDVGRLDDLSKIADRFTREQSKFADFKDSLSDFRSKYEAHEATLVEANRRDKDYDAASAEVKRLAEEIAATRSSIDGIISFGQPALDATTKGRIENALYELSPTTFFGEMFRKIVTLQPDILTLCLVVLMGVLGGSLQIASSFFSAEGRVSPGNYFLRLGFGAVTALAIFVLAKAGVVIVADPSKLGGESPINPYFVSFVAIVSGLMSERAVVAVQRQGEQFFANADVGTPRWARSDLHDMIEGDLTVDALARYLKTSDKTEVDAILAGQKPASAVDQQTIALYLRREIRDLFSDLPR
ncbi:hypothetical protein HL667_01180 [Bradyrhizobium sp. 83012]|uniref:Uncharacterized protein n=1 Tax=Bradyrhizobium aeschynomenes TaxID=2734909 RepID=A0ABX2C5Q3_9BRAD|nr:hypothetical protein [Bradyrhizobium aeschynomenes]NPU63606.1 hypothetical protein [Bradyrhizobium aeschynomenes]